MRSIAIIPSLLAVASAVVPNVWISSGGSEGVAMPMLAFGTAKTSFDNCTVQEAVTQWLRLGGRHIDTADDYGTQPDVGKAILASGVPRSEIFITTKIPGPIGKEATIDTIIGTALPQLGVDYIDLVLIHFPCLDTSTFHCPEQADMRRETWAQLAELRGHGYIRAVGVSNYGAEEANEIQDQFHEPPAVNQVQYHLASHDDVLLQSMKVLNTVVEAWASLGGPTVHGMKPTISLSDSRLKAVAARYNASTAQVALRWETMKGVVPVTATCSESHALGDLASFGLHLSDDDMTYLDALMPVPEEQVIV